MRGSRNRVAHGLPTTIDKPHPGEESANGIGSPGAMKGPFAKNSTSGAESRTRRNFWKESGEMRKTEDEVKTRAQVEEIIAARATMTEWEQDFIERQVKWIAASESPWWTAYQAAKIEQIFEWSAQFPEKYEVTEEYAAALKLAAEDLKEFELIKSTQK